MKKINFKQIGMRAAGVGMGGAVSYGVSLAANKLAPGLSPKIVNLGKVVLGLVIPEFVPKNKMIGEAGIALAGAGASDFFKSLIGGTGVQGIGDPEYVVEGNEEYAVNGNGDYVFGTENDAMSGANDALGNANDALGNENDVDSY